MSGVNGRHVARARWGPWTVEWNSGRVNCDHHRSWRFYAESVCNPNGFMGIQCTDSSQFDLGECNRVNVVPMGIATPSSARGKFYLHTNSQSPFAKGLQGI
ncbi:pancreatic triacylglycerol lipase-like [Lasioglossum baleicum]|uniref:pancreatic triacylglycerol lipase-like n=1 Tax=Lasioglossum baleicum TaxID=434251 RepID=UPI003FCEAB5A